MGGEDEGEQPEQAAQDRSEQPEVDPAELRHAHRGAIRPSPRLRSHGVWAHVSPQRRVDCSDTANARGFHRPRERAESLQCGLASVCSEQGFRDTALKEHEHPREQRAEVPLRATAISGAAQGQASAPSPVPAYREKRRRGERRSRQIRAPLARRLRHRREQDHLELSGGQKARSGPLPRSAHRVAGHRMASNLAATLLCCS